MEKPQVIELNDEPLFLALDYNAMLALEIKAMIAKKEMLVAQCNQDLAKYGEWQGDYAKLDKEIEEELKALFSRC